MVFHSMDKISSFSYFMNEDKIIITGEAILDTKNIILHGYWRTVKAFCTNVTA